VTARLTNRDVPSAAKATASTIQPMRKWSIPVVPMSWFTARPTETQPPIRNEKIAAMKAHKNRVPP
jgi:hypothetical protein